MHWYILAIVAFVGNLFDFIDGMVARKYHKTTAFGSFFDSTLDRIADFLMITPFAFAGIVSWQIVAPFLLFSFLISYARGTSEKVALTKGDTTTKFIFGLNVAEAIFVVITVLSGYTALERILYAYKKL